MFLITLLMLVGAALCKDGGTKSASDDINHMTDTLHNSAELRKDLVKLMSEIKVATKKFGCTLDIILRNNGTTLRDLLDEGVTPVAENSQRAMGYMLTGLLIITDKSIVEPLKTILEAILKLQGITENTVDLLWKALSPVLTSKCLKKLTKKELIQLVKELQDLLCKDENLVLDSEQILEILERLRCILGDVLEVKKILEETPEAEKLLEGLLLNAIDNIVNIVNEKLHLQLPAVAPLCSLMWRTPTITHRLPREKTDSKSVQFNINDCLKFSFALDAPCF
ncbi:uncharacterized protein LOC142099143 isoform X1 [Mixophyes fleayi]|uniref:uncharacterized protein LOC142099143 isoform X1 n=1 Tax=Mixophyes fleayi TaxID=3061075 RepID=UPI003F4D88FB